MIAVSVVMNSTELQGVGNTVGVGILVCAGKLMCIPCNYL